MSDESLVLSTVMLQSMGDECMFKVREVVAERWCCCSEAIVPGPNIFARQGARIRAYQCSSVITTNLDAGESTSYLWKKGSSLLLVLPRYAVSVAALNLGNVGGPAMPIPDDPRQIPTIPRIKKSLVNDGQPLAALSSLGTRAKRKKK